jgi:hypothetical protein
VLAAGINVGLAFYQRATHGQLIAKLGLHVLRAEGDKTDVLGRGGPATTYFQRALSDWVPLAVDAMVKAAVGTLLGGRWKDSTIDITRI